MLSFRDKCTEKEAVEELVRRVVRVASPRGRYYWGYYLKLGFLYGHGRP